MAASKRASTPLPVTAYPSTGCSRFRNSRVIVTGAARGIGEAIARRFLAEEAAVAITDLDASRLACTAHTLAAEFGPERVMSIACDVSDAAQVDRMVTAGVEEMGGVDVLVNNAGIATFGLAIELPEEEWDRVMDTNAKGVFLCSQRVARQMIRQECGSIVSIASEAGRRGEVRLSHYCAAKAAVINFGRALALELAPHIRVNTVCPGVIPTNMTRSEWAWRAEHLGQTLTETQRELVSEIPLRRLQEPEDIAAAVAFLASADARQITGQALSVDGGTVMV